MHQLHPYFLLYLFAVAQSVSQLANLDLPASIRIKDLKHLSDVILPDQEESIGAVCEEFREGNLFLSQTTHDLLCTSLRQLKLTDSNNLDEAIYHISFL